MDSHARDSLILAAVFLAAVFLCAFLWGAQVPAA